MSAVGRNIYGFAVDEPTDRASFLRAVHPEDRDAVTTAFDRGLNNRETFEIEHRIKK